MSEIVYLSGADLASTVARQYKTALMECSELVIPMPGFAVNLLGKKEMVFPEVGVDWRTVNLIGYTGSFVPVVFTPQGMVAKVTFSALQTGTVSVAEYSRWSTYVAAKVDDLPFDLFTYFGDPDLAKKQPRHVPIAVPVVDMRRTQIRRYAADAETAHVVGDLCIYGSADQGGINTVRTEASKLYRWMRANRFRFSQRGLTAMQFEFPVFNVYQDKLYEAAIPFTCVVNLQRAEAQPETPITNPVPPLPLTDTVIDGGNF